MTNRTHSWRALRVAAAAVAAMVLGIHASGPANFAPDGVFTGSSLAGWHAVGQADWKAENGELVGTAKPGGSGGWLVMDRSFQDLQFFTNFKCAGPCAAGVLLRAQKTADGGLQGIFVSLKEGDLASYTLVLDAQGREVKRDRLVAPAGRGGGGGGRGAAPGLRAGDWNAAEVILAAQQFRPVLNGRGGIAGGALDDASGSTFGPIALYAGGTGEVRFKDVSWKDVNAIAEPKEQVSSRFTMQRLSDLYYGWSAAAADINHDGNMDIVSGPFYYLGPAFSERKAYRAGRVFNPSTEYAPDMVNASFDFTGDGWPDILSSNLASARPMDLYVNPKGESRRWDKFQVLPGIITELVLMRDIDGDGKPEIVYGTGTGYVYADPDPANPTAPWVVHTISDAGRANIHGLGVGDVNGDKRQDLVAPSGWFEQPAKGSAQQAWTFHPATFGSGGAEMGVYDVNGDGLADVVTSLEAHGWGLAWFEQKRAPDGAASFVEHAIAGDYSTANAGNVVFSEPHGSRVADMDGDGIPDFIVGKRYWSHLENYNGPDPYGAPVVYVYRTVRNKNAPGGAEFVPELIHNRSGVGSAFEVMDLNKDGAPDIATSTAYGTFVFIGKPGARPAPRR